MLTWGGSGAMLQGSAGFYAGPQIQNSFFYSLPLAASLHLVLSIGFQPSVPSEFLFY